MDKRKFRAESQEWIRMMAGRLPKAGERWRHYKGKVVTVLCLAVREESGKVAVVYEEEGGDVWDRLLTVWNETVSHDGATVPRFAKESEGGTG